MKRLIIIMLLSLSNNANVVQACVFYPLNEDLRFTIFDPGNYGYEYFSQFYYSANLFGNEEFDDGIKMSINDPGVKQNISLWRKRCNNVPSEEDVYTGVYANESSPETSTSNTFFQYLKKHNDVEAINYIEFAKKCSRLNSFFEDPWEKSTTALDKERNELIAQATEGLKKSSDQEIKLRYGHLLIRLAFYNRNSALIQKTYKENFTGRKEFNIIDYWAMHFYTMTLPDGAKANYYASMVFSFAPDKRFASYQNYSRKIPLEQTLKFAKSKKEKSAIWLLAGITKHAKAIECLQNIYSLEPNSEGLSFLLLREVNKLEDWIYTPYYTFFQPSVYDGQYPESKFNERISDSRMYAQQVLTFINCIDIKKVQNPDLWKISKAYLLFMTEDYSACISFLKAEGKRFDKQKSLKDQSDMIRSLCLIAKQPTDSAVIPISVRKVLMYQNGLNNQKFIFAVAKELEFKHNTTDAAMLFAKINPVPDNYENTIYWKTKKRHTTLFTDYYDNFFFYMDAQYKISDVKKLIENIEHKKEDDEFTNWKYIGISNQIDRLCDLLGTKYMRINDLKNALASFKKVNRSLWSSGEFEIYLNANPFYTNAYNEHSVTAADSAKYDKEKIVRELIMHLQQAENIKNTDRDYHYFLVANCYFNMTQYGNSWMMKRYYWTGTEQETKLIDDREYFNCDLAKEYYLKAKQVSRYKRFSALCLRMAGRCEKYKLTRELGNKRYSRDFDKKVFSSNKFYSQLKNSYPYNYEELISNCESFQTYFNERKMRVKI